MAARASSAARDWQQDVGSLDRNNNGGFSSSFIFYFYTPLIHNDHVVAGEMNYSLSQGFVSIKYTTWKPRYLSQKYDKM